MRGGMPGPARVVEDRPRKCLECRIAGPDNGFGLLKLGNQPAGDHRYSCCFLYGACQRYLVARSERDLLGRRETAARYVNGGAATRLQRLRKGDCLFDIPTGTHPVGTGYAHGNHAVRRERAAYRLKNFERKAYAVLQAPAILIVASVGEGREN